MLSITVVSILSLIISNRTYIAVACCIASLLTSSWPMINVYYSASYARHYNLSARKFTATNRIHACEILKKNIRFHFNIVKSSSTQTEEHFQIDLFYNTRALIGLQR
jgi:hypothetical protein